jgi:putative ABC transport system permease protein
MWRIACSKWSTAALSPRPNELHFPRISEPSDTLPVQVNVLLTPDEDEGQIGDPFLRVVTKAFLRYLLRRRGLSVLQLMGISCGVAAAVGMALSSRTALSSFTQAVEFIRGKATHTLQRPAGPLEETVLKRLMLDPAVEAFSPVLDRRLRLLHGETVRILGIDPLLDRTIRPEIARTRGRSHQAGDRKGALSFMLDERAVLADFQLSQQLGLAPGDRFETSHGTLNLEGAFPNPAGESLLLMDIAHAQAIFNMTGRVDRVDLILSDEQGFCSRWSEGFLIQSRQQSRLTLGDMLRAFRLNLEALSLLALLVGIFLIYNTAMFTVVSRRQDAGILRSLGAKRHEIMFAFLAEIMLLGIIGGALGGVLGYLLSHLLTELVGTTISKLYFDLRPVPAAWSWTTAAFGVILGCGASFLGGLLPLVDLVRQNPVRVLRGRVPSRDAASSARKAALAGMVLLMMSLVLLKGTSLYIYFGFAGAFGLLMGASLLTGIGLVILGPPMRWLLDLTGGLPGKVAAGNIRENLGRTSVAVAAFMVALSMSVGLGSMIGSFRHTLIWWMDSQLRGDLYIAPSREDEIPEGLYSEIQSIPGIGGLDVYRNVQTMYRGTPVRISAINAAVLQEFTRFGWLKGGNENWEPVKQGAVIVSESFCRRFHVEAGDRLSLEGVHGTVELEVAAVFYDYTTEHGLIMMDRSTYMDIFQDPTIDSLVVFMNPEQPDRQRVLDRVMTVASRWGVPVAPRQQFHGTILGLFDATFAVTRSMRLLAVLVAFLGIAGALLTLFMERQREFGIYRALGFSTSQVSRMTLMEGLGMGLASFAFSTFAGTALALVLIRAINLQSFHWTIFYHFNWGPYLNAFATAILASVGAAVYPIWRVCRTYPQMQIREE